MRSEKMVGAIGAGKHVVPPYYGETFISPTLTTRDRLAELRWRFEFLLLRILPCKFVAA